MQSLADLKKIAMDPNADVGIVGGISTNSAPTIQISEDELAAIKNAAATDAGISMFPVNKSSGEFNEENEALENFYQAEDYDEEYDEDEDDSLFDEEYDEDEKRELDPKMEKLITIGAIAATVVIAIIIIVAIVSISGGFKKKDKTTEQPSTVESVNMISVVGLEEEKAITALREAGIAYEIEREYSDTFEEGLVMNQSVKEGTKIEETDKVKLIISKGKEEVDVPDVVGKTLEEAKAALTAAGFEVDEDDEYDEEVEKDYIISQTPGGNTKAAKGSTVKIVVSRGKEVKVAKVPNLKKKTVTAAESALSEVNLKLGNVSQEYSDSIEEGKVIRQSIEEGTEVKEGTAIDITISKGKEPKTKTYTATFTGSISNKSYSFEEGESVFVELILKVGDASYTVVSDYYSEASFPIQLSNCSSISGLTSNNASLIYSVKDEGGNDITGNFTSSGQAKLKTVEQ